MPIIYHLSSIIRKKRAYTITLIFVLALCYALRVYGQMWDQGLHLHPDERMLIMVTSRIHFPENIYPDFFNYGSLPMYLLSGFNQLGELSGKLAGNYDTLLPSGRTLSAMIDVGTAVFTYLIAWRLTKRKILALWALFFYAIAFFPIQNSHFFVVDVPMTFFTTLLVYLLILYSEKPVVRTLVLLGIVSAAGFATKFTFVLFLPVTALVICMSMWPKKKSFMGFVPPVLSLIIYILVTALFHFVFMPYAYLAPSGLFVLQSLDSASFSREVGMFLKEKDTSALMNYLLETLSRARYIHDILDQTRMNSDAYVFPYTLQYVYTRAYTYPLWNIFMWGLGPWISILSIIGAIGSVCRSWTRNHGVFHWKFQRKLVVFILVGIYGFYFLMIGKSAVKFMRYMLPLYPLFAISAAYGIGYLFEKFSFVLIPSSCEGEGQGEVEGRSVLKTILGMILVVAATVWTGAFMHIYMLPHSRVQATTWMLSHIPMGQTLATEHWDDRLPLQGGEIYQYVELPMYEHDSPEKTQLVQGRLRSADYIVLASNRLYVPLQKLADCDLYRVCYPDTAVFYRELLANRTNFKQVAEFSSYPQISLGPWHWNIVDDSADESFTVYDHPKVLIFKKQ